MIVRDEETKTIGQHRSGTPEYLDFGDSARATGMMAMSGSVEDRDIMPSFEVAPGLLARHPKVAPYDDPRSFTRDQLLQFTAGYLNDNDRPGWAYRRAAKRIFWSHAKRGFLCQNTYTLFLEKKAWWNRDILTPSHIGHLIKVAKIYWLYPFLAVAWLWLLLDILWSAKVKPNDENNQIIAMCAVAGDWALKLYCKLNPSWAWVLLSYWGGWRDQKEIAGAIIEYIDKRIQ